MTIIIKHNGEVWKQTPTAYYRNGEQIAAHRLPLYVRYLLGMATVGEAPL